ncbi:MAG: helix-turn-helix domain-containing protein [Actinomycetota bacterium]
MTYEPNTDDLPELITVADVANYLGLTPQTVISFIKRGDLVATKPPGMRGYRIPRQAFEDYLAAGYRAVQDEVMAEAEAS